MDALDMFPHHFLGRGSAFENAVLEILRGDGGYLLPHFSIELPSICALDRLPLLIGERDCRNIVVRVRDRDRGPPLRHGSTVTTVPLKGWRRASTSTVKMCDGWLAGPAPSGMLS